MLVIDMELKKMWDEYKSLHYGANWNELSKREQIEIETVFKCSAAYFFKIFAQIGQSTEHMATYTFSKLVRESEDFIREISKQ